MESTMRAKSATWGGSSMGEYEKLPGQERQTSGALSVQCPQCGAPAGFACRKKKGKGPYDSRKARRERAYGEALAQSLAAAD
jgi:hypothetical protein